MDAQANSRPSSPCQLTSPARSTTPTATSSAGQPSTCRSASTRRDTTQPDAGSLDDRLGGPAGRARARERGAPRQPARRSVPAAGLGLRPSRLRRVGAALPERLRDPGDDGAARHVAQPEPVPPQLPRARRRAVRGRRRAAGDRRVRRLLDVVRRQPVPRLARHGPLPHVPLRRGGRRSSTSAIARSRTASTGASWASPAGATGRW